MATKDEWKEYFQLMNDREPTLADYEAAVENGEIEEKLGISQTVSPSSSSQGIEQTTYKPQSSTGFVDEMKSDLTDLTDSVKNGRIKEILLPDKKLDQLSLFKLGSFGAAVSTIVSILSAIIGFIVLGTITSSVGSFFTNWAANNSNSNVQYSFNSAQYQNAVNGITAAATFIALISLVVGIVWMWFTVYRLKSRQFKGWSIYFLVIGILGALGILMTLFSDLATFSTYTALMNELGIKYSLYMLWGAASLIINAGIDVIWILIFIKSRKINS